jgi:CcmD family protein
VIKGLLGAVVAWLLTVPVFALQAPSGQTTFVPVDQLPPGEQLPSAPLLVAAYAFVWVAVLFYVWLLWRRLNKVEGEMHTLQQRQAQRGNTR